VFRRHHAAAPAATVTLVVDGVPTAVPEGVSVAAALLGGGHASLGSAAVSGSPRGPWCLMGACFGCLVEIDGAPGERACMTPVRDGLRVALRASSAGTRAERDPWDPGA